MFAGEQRIDKAGMQLPESVELAVRGADHPFVSRGGLKLAGALDGFGYHPAGKVAADFGASTGGFTDCLLQRGAARVYAVDVGYGQLHERLRSDDRVVVMERTNARHLGPGSLPESVDLVVIDAAFIGLDRLLPAALALLRGGGDIIALVKPQFEVGREALHKGGVVRDARARAQAIGAVKARARRLGLELRGALDSSLAGPRGNLEHFVWWESTTRAVPREP